MRLFKKDNNKDKKKNGKIKIFFRKINIFRREQVEVYSFKEVVIVMFFSLGLGLFAAFQVTNILNGGKNYRVLNKDLSKFVSAYDTILDNYYGDIDKDALVSGAIEGMLGVLTTVDPYTSYIDSTTSKDFLQKLKGTYSGIGCTVAMTMDGDIIILSVFDDGPAFLSGLQAGDIVLEVNSVDYSEKTATELSNYIQSDSVYKFKMKIKRGEEEKDITIDKKKIEIPSVESDIILSNDKKIGYLDVSIFSSVTDEQFENKLKKLESEKIDSLIIDVRDNDGGYLDVASKISSLFLKKGKVIYQLQNNDGKKVVKDTDNKDRKYKIVVLINKNSASASEILAAAIKESYNGYVVGVNSYGKATVQQAIELTDGSMVKYTIQKWLTPNGTWANEVGITPTHEVMQIEEYYNNPIRDNDAQLKYAIDLLSE